jgi:hypothetical protein
LDGIDASYISIYVYLKILKTGHINFCWNTVNYVILFCYNSLKIRYEHDFLCTKKGYDRHKEDKSSSSSSISNETSFICKDSTRKNHDHHATQV